MKRLAVVLAVIAALLVAGLGSAVATSLVTSAGIKDKTIQNVDLASSAVDGRVVKDKSIAKADLALSVRPTWAHVSETGTLLGSSGGVTPSKLGSDGAYSVNFGRNVSNCAYVGSIDGSNGAEGEVSVGPSDSSVNAVFVQTFVFGTPAVDTDLPFYLAVFC